MRMVALYTVAHELNSHLTNKRVRVIGTGNLSEDFIGYDTKGGDALCDIFPIGELYKSEVYQLAEYFVEQGDIEPYMIDYTPSAGLWDGQTDEEELGFSYNDMEPAIRKMRSATGKLECTDPLTLSTVEKFVYDRHLANKHKHEAPPVIELRVTPIVE
jgi:NAD+ synthase